MDVKTVVGTIVAITIGIVLIGNLLVPQAEDVIASMKLAGHDSWAALVSVVVVCAIIALVVVALYVYK